MNSAQTHIYRWHGTTLNGERRKGKSCAYSKGQLSLQLQQQGITPIYVQPTFSLRNARQRILTEKQLIDLLSQLTPLISHGVPLRLALSLLTEQTSHGATFHLLTTIRENVEAGHGFSESLRLAYPLLKNQYLQLLKLGENTGTLPDSMHRLCTQYHQQQELVAHVKKALRYPIIVFLAAILVALFMLLFIIPSFDATFAQMNVPLPVFTQLMVEVSLFLRHYAFTMLVIFVVAMSTGWLLLKKHQRLKARLEYGMLKLPLIGRLIIFANLAQCLSTFSSCLKGGMNTTDSLQCAVEAITSPAIKQQFRTLPSLVKNGFAAHTAFSQFAITPPVVTQLLKIGEETGQFIPMLTTCDDQLRQQVNQTVDRLTSLLEPIIISWIGLIVGSLVISMYLPIFNLMSAMG